jgi:Flp pilus assembly protein TadB
MLPSERVVVASPMSLTGSARRIWRMTKGDRGAVAKLLLVALAMTLIGLVWMPLILWNLALFLVAWPYRLVRRGQRQRKRERLVRQELA